MKKMHNINLLLRCLCLMALPLMALACGDDDDEQSVKVPAEARGTFTDERDGQTYGWVRYGGLDWMTENYRYDTGNSASTIYLDDADYDHHKDSQKNLPKHGRLYNMAGARQACPEGWRLPTDEDWQQLEKAVGMSAGEAVRRDWRGHVALSLLTTADSETDLSLRLSGYYISSTNMGRSGYRFLGVYGFYWTATRDEAKDGEFYFYRKLIYNNSAIYRESMEKDLNYLSVRYVRTAP